MKRRVKKNRQMIAGMTGILSMATFAVVQIPTPTYALLADHELLDGNANFTAAFVFPQTVNDLATQASLAVTQVNQLLLEIPELLGSSAEPGVTEDVYNISIPDPVEPIDDVESVEPITNEMDLIDAQLHVISMEIEKKKSQLLVIEQISLNAHSYEEEAWAIVGELNHYYQRAIEEEATRILLYVEPALQTTDATTREATTAVNQIDQYMSSLISEIEELQQEYDRLAASKVVITPVEPETPMITPDLPDPQQELENPIEGEPAIDPVSKPPIHIDPQPEDTTESAPIEVNPEIILPQKPQESLGNGTVSSGQNPYIRIHLNANKGN